MPDYNLALIRQMLSEAFSIGEINTLAFDLFPKLQDDFATGASKSDRIQQLVTKANQNGRLPDLIAAVKKENPHQYEIFADQLNKATSSPENDAESAIADLEKEITKEQKLLVQYEDMERMESDPRRRLKLQENIEEVKQHILTRQTRIAQLRQELAPTTALIKQSSTFLTNAPYGLESKLVGRKDELFLLDDWFQNDHSHPLMAVIGLGGQGKSALTWEWMQKLRDAKTAPPLVVWWSFYEVDGTVAHMAREILRYFGDNLADSSNTREMVTCMMQHLQQQRALLILDGAERLLRAYGSLGAAYQADGTEAEADWQRTRQGIDPVTDTLLTWLADPALSKAQTLLSSRLFPQVLAGRGGNGLAGVRRHDLTGLNADSAYELFSDLKIRATRAEVQAVAEPLGYHPLSLRLLVGWVANDPERPDDLQAAVGYDPTVDLLGKRQHVMARAYGNLPQTAQYLLSRMAALRSSCNWVLVQEAFGAGNRTRRDLTILELRGLVQRTVRQGENGQAETSYDLHPIVRRYAYDRLRDRAAVHGQLVIYFEAVPQPQRVQTLDDLRPAIELYHHMIQAKRYDEASVLFQDRLHTPLYYQLGAYQTCSNLLQGLFPDGEAELSRLTKEADQAWTLAVLGSSYSLSGQPGRAVLLKQQHNVIREKQSDKVNLAIGLGNLALDQFSIGSLEATAVNLRRSITLCQEIEDRFREAVGHRENGRLLATIGDWEAAEAELKSSTQYWDETNHYQALCVDWAYRALAALWQGQVAEGLHAAQEALRLAEEDARTSYPVERDFVQAYWLLGWAQAELGQLTAAQDHLDEALRRCRAINNVEHEPSILLALARLVVAQSEGGTPDEALALAQEALVIAERSVYVLNQADIHNFLAAVALASGQQEEARQHAQRAHELATCDGPPYVYKPALDEAARLLAVVGER